MSSNDERETRISVRLPVNIVEALKRLAAESDRSFSGEVRRALRQYVERESETGKA